MILRKRSKLRKVILGGLFILFGILFLYSANAAHYIAGIVNNSLDGASANGFEVVLWNSALGISDNLTGIIGPDGDSGTDNFYFLDCEMLSGGCNIGDILNIKVVNNGSDYVSSTAQVSVSGAGFDLASDLILNSKPNVSLYFPEKYMNLSYSLVNFSCYAQDLDGNLANVTLYGNWSGSWQANETKSINGSEGYVNFNKNLTEGRYSWSCYVQDNFSIGSFAEVNGSFTVDLTLPSILNANLNNSGSTCDNQTMVRVNCSASDMLSGINEVWVELIKSTGNQNYSANWIIDNNYYADIFINQNDSWNFRCWVNDSAGNTAGLLVGQNITLGSPLADLFINQSSMVLDVDQPVENQTVMVNISIKNIGCGNADNVLVGFFEGEPNIGEQFGTNSTISLNSSTEFNLSKFWSAKIGSYQLFVLADVNNSISESYKNNNGASKNISIRAWQDLYGNITLDKLLGNNNVNNLSLWFNQSSFTGNIFVTDKESNIHWGNLIAFGRNSSLGNTTDDFFELDGFLNMGSLNDSISNFFTIDGNTPRMTDSFFIHNKNIDFVPVISSATSSPFYTGLLWDNYTDSDNQYGAVDKEEIIFVTKINKSANGAYGLDDYEITLPARLRDYKVVDRNDVFIYFDLN